MPIWKKRSGKAWAKMETFEDVLRSASRTRISSRLVPSSTNV
jgi:hypothetical protein